MPIQPYPGLTVCRNLIIRQQLPLFDASDNLVFCDLKGILAGSSYKDVSHKLKEKTGSKGKSECKDMGIESYVGGFDVGV